MRISDEGVGRDGASIRIPGLQILEEIGRGADSVVYRAVKGDRTFALKVLRENGGGGSSGSAMRFWREAGLLTRVRHPGLPGVMEVGEVDGRLFSVMEYVEGRTLASLLQSGPLPEESIVGVAKLLASTLAVLHRYGLVHRDIKPGNILLDRAGRAKLIDFGLATQARGGTEGDTAVGTFVYSAPEQTGMLKRPVDGRSDLYGLGVVLYECATGAPPFRSSDLGELVRLHAVTLPIRVTELNPSTTPALAAVIEKLLAKDPDDRYQTGHGLLVDLERLPILNAALRRGETVAFGALDEPGESSWETPLVGRTGELAELRLRWEAARNGEGGVVLVEGEAGCGKSRLVGTLSAAAREGGALVLSAACSQGDPLPFAPLRAAVDGLLGRLARLPAPLRLAAEERVRRSAGVFTPLLMRFSPSLAAVLSAAPLAGAAEMHEQFYAAVAELLFGLAREHGALLLVLDDVDGLDEGSRRVLLRLSTRLKEAPLLVVGTARRSPDRADLVADDVVPFVLVTLAPLDESGVAALAAAYLGGQGLPPDFVRQLAVRSNGNPLAAAEYLRAMLDAGLLRPSWGAWRVDTEGLERLALPTDVLALVVQRIDGLSEPTRAFLRIAAAVGTRFGLEIVANVLALSPEALAMAVEEATLSHLIERAEGGGYAFLHEKVREGLLSRLDEAERARLHQSIAEALDVRGGEGTAHLYALARHYGLGEIARSPLRAYETNRAAGLSALEGFADEDALGFFLRASRAAVLAGLTPAPEIAAGMGDVCARGGRPDEAREHYDSALDVSTSPSGRARLRAKVAGLEVARREIPLAWEQIEAAFAEMRGSPPSMQPLPMAWTLGQWLLALASEHLGIGFGTAKGLESERLRLLSKLYEEAAKVAYLGGRTGVFVQVALRSLYVAGRLGPSRELTRSYVKYGILLVTLGRARAGEAYLARALRISESLKDPASVAYCLAYAAVTRHLAGFPREAEERSRRAIEEHGRWLEAGDYRNVCGDLIWNLFLRGYAREGHAWEKQAAQREMRQVTSFSLYSHSSLAILGQEAQGWDVLTRALEGTPLAARNAVSRRELIAHSLVFYVEVEATGAPMDEMLGLCAELGLNPARETLHIRHIYVFRAYARLAQCLASSAEERPARLALLAEAVAPLRTAARHPVLRGHRFVVEGALARLSGRRVEALARYGEAESLADEHDAPWIRFEAARERARLLLAEGSERAGRRQARFAHELALEHGWVGRARRVRLEFGLGDLAQSLGRSADSSSKDSADGRALHLQRHLSALSQVSLAASTVLDPIQQARAALDEIVKILGAERAFLFLLDDDGKQLVLKAGRDAKGNDIPEEEGYSRTLVERVRVDHRPLVMTGAGDGAAMGSPSAIRHGIRSALAAPLLMRDRFVGVVYLDSRLVRGIFSERDVDILLAIANHIAIAIETARAAQLDGQYQAERRERELAERLRALTGALSASLERSEIMERLLESLAQLVPSDRSAVLLREGDGFRVAAVTGDTALGPAPGAVVGAREDELLEEVARTLEPVRVTSDGAPGSPRSRLALPLVFGGAVSGAVTLESAAAGAFGAREAEVALTVSGQAATALENARLFAEVRRLAVTDELTGIHSRRHLFVLAGREFSRCRRYHRPLTAILLDIDHFKKVNDTHGHAVGDEVLREVARRCAVIVRDTDILGRYGGEEFVVVLPETDPAAGEATAGRLRESLASEPVETSRGPLALTMSVGVASSTDETSSLEKLLERADAAMYEAKEAGRNKVAIAR